MNKRKGSFPALNKRNETLKGGDSMLREFLYDESGMGVVEIILIIVVLIGLVVIFQSNIKSVVSNIFSKINSGVSKVN